MNDNIFAIDNNNVIKKQPKGIRNENGKYEYTKEQKQIYLEAYKSRPAYHLMLNCPLCDSQYIKAFEKRHVKGQKHIFNQACYDEAQIVIKQNNITDVNEQVKIYTEIKFRNIYKANLEKIKQKHPSYFEHISLFEKLQI
jgi:hypothetical protein